MEENYAIAQILVRLTNFLVYKITSSLISKISFWYFNFSKMNISILPTRTSTVIFYLFAIWFTVHWFGWRHYLQSLLSMQTGQNSDDLEIFLQMEDDERKWGAFIQLYKKVRPNDFRLKMEFQILKTFKRIKWAIPNGGTAKQNFANREYCINIQYTFKKSFLSLKFD